MIKWIVKRCLLSLLSDDDQLRMKLTEVANPDLAWEIKYGDRKNPPPKPRFGWWKSVSRKVRTDW